jgi:hypothetical protein
VIERVIVYLVATVLLLGLLAEYLPRVTPSLIALGVLVLVGRVVWWRTR